MKRAFEERPGDWYCEGCPQDKFGRALNFASRDRCVKCGQPRAYAQPHGAVQYNPYMQGYGGYAAAAASARDYRGGGILAMAPQPQQAARAPAISERQGDWYCEDCPEDKFRRALNFASRDKCFKCNRPRYSTGGSTYDPPHAAASSAAAAAASSSLPYNPDRVEAAPAGKVAKVASEPKVTFNAGEWLCVACVAHHDKGSDKCVKCSAVRPALAIVATDESKCVVCYASFKNGGFLHGGDVHICTCASCAAQLSYCPLCLEGFDRRVTLFF